MKKLVVAGLISAFFAVWTPLAFAHATVNLLIGNTLTASTATWFLRVPNERPNKSTYKVVMSVPTDIQGSISVKQTPGWNLSLTRVPTGQTDGAGLPIYNITQVTWRAQPGNLIVPGTYTSFEFRFRNPSTPEQLCFPTDQFYNGTARGVAGELVSWSGPSTSATPASCVSITST
jgi:uncharacterized protein YcnI